jgi:hypothetical protein
MFLSNCKVSRVRQALDTYSSNELTSAVTNDDNYIYVWRGIPFVPIFPVQSRIYGFYRSLSRCPDKFGLRRQMSLFPKSYNTFLTKHNQGSQTSRFWRNRADFESCVPCPAWICGGSHICNTFRNFWITLTNISYVFFCSVSYV